MPSVTEHAISPALRSQLEAAHLPIALMSEMTSSVYLPTSEEPNPTDTGLQVADRPLDVQQAYQEAATPGDKARLFTQLRQTYQARQDYEALLTLTQEHLQNVQTPQEQVGCLLLAGEALINLHRYREARLQYLEPALAIPAADSETRLHLWHYLGLSHLAEHAFTEAATAFRQSADLALGQHFTNAATRPTVVLSQLHHLRNAGQFYDGIIHLLYHRPQQAVQAFQELQRPLTVVGSLNVALFLALAYRRLQQPEAATRALQPLLRATTTSEALRGAAAVVRVGIANLSANLAEAGEHCTTALSLVPSAPASWEPTWRALLCQELGDLLQRLGCRGAARACCEEGLKVLVWRTGLWPEASPYVEMHGDEVLSALAILPLSTLSDLVKGEMLRLLQTLAWLDTPGQPGGRAERALALAGGVTTTVEQEAGVWFHRGWLRVTGLVGNLDQAGVTSPSLMEMQQGLETVLACHPHGAWSEALQGMLALLARDGSEARRRFAMSPGMVAVPEVQGLLLALWLWSHASIGEPTVDLADPLPWQTPTELAAACEALLAWNSDGHLTLQAWLPWLLKHQPVQTLATLQVLCQVGYVPLALRTVLLATLTRLTAEDELAAVTDQLTALIGGTVLVKRVEASLAELHQHLCAEGTATPQAGRGRKKQSRRQAAPRVDTGSLLELIGALPRAATLDASLLAETIAAWLRTYPHLGLQAPEVVSALLAVLRQCPEASAIMQMVLAQIPLSKRQHQALETASYSSQIPVVRIFLDWEEWRYRSMGQWFETLSGYDDESLEQTLETARSHYILALIMARADFPRRALASLQVCLTLQPDQALVHYELARIAQLLQHPDDALQHALQAWKCLQETGVPSRFFHVEILTQILILLESMQRYEQFPMWLQAFAQRRQELTTAALEPLQQQRLQEAEGNYALWRALYASSAPAANGRIHLTLEEQLDSLREASQVGAPTTQYRAFHRQAEIFSRLQHYEEASATYTRILQRWPDDHQASLRLTLLTIIQQPETDVATIDQLLGNALRLAMRGVVDPPSPLTSQSALAWLQHHAGDISQIADLIDVLTVDSRVALQRHEYTRVIELLTPVYGLAAQPLRAYYLAEAYYARSLEAASESEQSRENDRALSYVQQALAGEAPEPQATALLQQIQAQQHTLATARQHEEAFLAYYDQVCQAFARYDVPIYASEDSRAPQTPWLSLHEAVDVDETSGELVTTIHLGFNHAAVAIDPHPSVQDVTFYAQHQGEVRQLLRRHGLDALPWPPTPYVGKTDFAVIFPERLALNRDLLFIAFADLHALLRYARVLRPILEALPVPSETDPALAGLPLAAAARYVTLLHLLRQRLHTIMGTVSSKILQRQIRDCREWLTLAPALEHLQQWETFRDTCTYFQTLIDAMRSYLDTPPVEQKSVQSEERQLRRPVQRKRRQRQPRQRLEDRETL